MESKNACFINQQKQINGRSQKYALKSKKKYDYRRNLGGFSQKLKQMIQLNEIFDFWMGNG